MKKKCILCALSVFLLGALPYLMMKEDRLEPPPWMVYYDDTEPLEAFERYDPIIFDAGLHIPIKPLLDQNKTVLGYLNIGEAEERHDWFATVKSWGIVIADNPEWPGSWSVDIRDPRWSDFLLHQLIPNIVSQGFSGLFLDQVDVSLELENQHPEKYQGMTKAAIALIQNIRKQYQGLKIMLNRGYEILPQVGAHIDFELAETLYSSYDFATNTYYLRSKDEVEWQLKELQRAKSLFPSLIFFSLDYWDPQDRKMIKRIYAVERGYGMRPYVTSPFLNEITQEPVD